MSELLRDIPVGVGTVRCGRSHHQLVWRDGALAAPAHPDPEAELALIALGGEPCRCVELLGHWELCAADPRALILGPRERTLPHADPAGASGTRTRQRPLSRGPGRPGQPPGTSVAMSAGGASTTISSRWIGQPAPAGATQRPDVGAEDPLLALLQISDSLSRRLVATVIAALIEQDDPSYALLLDAALYGRLLAGLTRWHGSTPELALEVVDRSAPRGLSRTNDHSYRAELPLEWLTEVWTPDLTHTHDGQFTLSASPLPAGGRELRTVDCDLTASTRRT